MIANVDGSGIHPLATRTGSQQYETTGPAWSPDGKHIAVQAIDLSTPPVFYPTMLDVSTGKEHRLGARNWTTYARLRGFRMAMASFLARLPASRP